MLSWLLALQKGPPLSGDPRDPGGRSSWGGPGALVTAHTSVPRRARTCSAACTAPGATTQSPRCPSASSPRTIGTPTTSSRSCILRLHSSLGVAAEGQVGARCSLPLGEWSSCACACPRPVTSGPAKGLGGCVCFGQQTEPPGASWRGAGPWGTGRVHSAPCTSGGALGWEWGRRGGEGRSMGMS